MSTPFYDLASLVVVPSGYKTSKVYAQKPLTTDGQLAFSRASTATRVNASGLIESVASGVPRLDYLGSTCPKLLLEPQRTNSILDSNSFATWGGSNFTITTGQSNWDGSTRASLLTTAVSGFQINQSATLTGNTSFSIYAKKGSVNGVCLYSSSAGQGKHFNLDTGGLGSDFVAAPVSASMQNLGSGWYRCTIVANSAGSGTWRVYTSNGISTNVAGSITISDAQVELGSYPTSIITTTTAAVTRLADAAYKTGISSLIGQAEGTLFADIQATTTGYWYISLSSGSNANWVFVGQDVTTGSKLRAFFRAGSVTYADIFSGVITSGRYKMAIAYKANDIAFYVNGVQIGTDSSAVMATGLNNFYISSPNASGGDQAITGAVNQTLLFKTRLTNAQLAELTTL